jgi:hypothetical protein
MTVVTRIKHPAREFISDYLDYLIGASSFIVALAWNSAFQKYFEHSKFLKNSGPWIYAISLTFIITIIMLIIKRVKTKLPTSDDLKLE